MTWRPDDEASLAGWWKATDLSAGTVTSWAAHDGNGPTMTVASGAMGGPEAGATTTPNGRPAVQFVNASQEALRAAVAGVEDPCTFAMFASVAGSADSQFYAGFVEGNVDYLQARADRWRGRLDGGSTADVVTAPSTAWQMFALSVASDVVTHRVGALSATGTATSAVISQIVLGSFRASGQTDPTAHWADMSAAEAVLFDASVSLSTIAAYFAQQWVAERFDVDGVTMNLAAADPTQELALAGTLVHDGPLTRWRAAFDEPRRGGP